MVTRLLNLLFYHCIIGLQRNGVDLGGLSPLHYIAARGWIRTARVLLDSYADINQRDNSMVWTWKKKTVLVD